MPRGEKWGLEEKGKIEASIRALWEKPDYTDAKAAEFILAEHHIDIPTLSVRVFRVQKLRLLQRVRGPKGADPGVVQPNLETAEGQLEVIDKALDNMAQRMEEAVAEMGRAYEAAQELKERLKARPAVSPEEAAAINVLRRKK